MSHVVVTSCTNRKRAKPPTELRAATLPKKRLPEVAAEWGSRLGGGTPRVPVARLYCGRSFREAEKASAEGALFVVSAGLGVVSGETAVPSYSLTVSGQSADNVLRRLSDAGDPSEWWGQVQRRSPFSTTLARVAADHGGPILIALPAQYLRMIAGDLARLATSVRRRLRIFTRAAGAFAALGPYVMPYDGRLDGDRSSIRGTQGDFAQRAARHFVEHVLRDAPRASAKRHQERVEGLLCGLKPPSRVQRVRMSDAEIADLIRCRWTSQDGGSTRMLRHLRDDLRIACEQARFRDLFLAVQAERG